MNHKKNDRMFGLAEQWRLPLVFYAEGGGGRPGDTDRLGITGLDVPSFAQFARLCGLVPLVGVVSGRCFAGNAAMLGCCDVIIATRNSSIGMGGPAMIEGGGLGVFHPDEVGPVSLQAPNGVIDIVVEDEVEAVAVAQKYLSYFQGRDRRLDGAGPAPAAARRSRRTGCGSTTSAPSSSRWPTRDPCSNCARDFGVGIDHRVHPHRGPAVRPDRQQSEASRRRDRRRRGRQGRALHAALRRLRHSDRLAVRHAGLHGRARGREDGDRASRLPACSSPARASPCRCSASCCARATASVRRRWSAAASTPPFFTVAWPTGEFGGMGLEGAVRLGFRKELAAIDDAVEREKSTADGGEILRQREGDHHRLRARDRRGDRSGRHPPLDPARPPIRAQARTAPSPQAALHRCLVGENTPIGFPIGRGRFQCVALSSGRIAQLSYERLIRNPTLWTSGPWWGLGKFSCISARKG